jgi:hypothetical protein
MAFRVRSPQRNIEVYHALWKEVHNKKQEATPEWFADWLGRVPSAGCGCRAWLRDYIEKNPPIYGEGFYEYSVFLHDAVNQKRGKPVWDRVS